VREQHDGSLRGVGRGDGASDPAARAGHDRVQAVQPARPGRFSRRV
jgi:hypothetical protein